jgi:hypothetical protein
MNGRHKKYKKVTDRQNTIFVKKSLPQQAFLAASIKIPLCLLK